MSQLRQEPVCSQSPAKMGYQAIGIQIAGWVLAALLVWLSSWLSLSLAWSGLKIAILQGVISSLLARLKGMPVWWVAIHLVFFPLLLITLSLSVPSWVYLVAFVLFSLVFWTTFRTRVPFFLTNRQTLDALVPEISHYQPQRILDLGCASGQLLKQLAIRFPDRLFSGYEIAPAPFLIAKWRLKNLPHVTVGYGDFWRLDFGHYDLVYAFLSDEPMAQLWQKVVNEMRPGSVFISNTFEVPELKADREIAIEDFRGTKLFIYEIKAPVEQVVTDREISGEG